MYQSEQNIPTVLVTRVRFTGQWTQGSVSTRVVRVAASVDEAGVARE